MTEAKVRAQWLLTRVASRIATLGNFGSIGSVLEQELAEEIQEAEERGRRSATEQLAPVPAVRVDVGAVDEFVEASRQHAPAPWRWHRNSGAVMDAHGRTIARSVSAADGPVVAVLRNTWEEIRLELLSLRAEIEKARAWQVASETSEAAAHQRWQQQYDRQAAELLSLRGEVERLRKLEATDMGERGS